MAQTLYEQSVNKNTLSVDDNDNYMTHDKNYNHLWKEYHKLQKVLTQSFFSPHKQYMIIEQNKSWTSIGCILCFLGNTYLLIFIVKIVDYVNTATNRISHKRCVQNN